MGRVALAVGLVLCVSAFAQTTVPSAQPMKGKLLEGMGAHHHPVSTRNAEAQQLFDQGLALMFGFNYDEAMRSFSRAAELDPNLAMAQWGLAMAVGPNYNVDIDATREKAAYEHVQKALQRSGHAGEPERDYIGALAKRYSNADNPDLKKLAADYSAAMRDLHRKYPDDLDAAAFYAESLMLLTPWALWTPDGKPTQYTDEIVELLEGVLKRDPDHLFANHLYIHAIEAGPHPERALESAGRLPILAPAAGHLVHMPAHVYSRTGDHAAAAGANESAATVDEQYLKDRNDGGMWGMMYYSHNLHFGAYSHAMQGRYSDAISCADRLAANTAPHLEHMPMLEGFAITPTIVMVRFHKWNELLKLPAPPENLVVSRLTWHFARAMALAATGRADEAADEQKLMHQTAGALPADAPYGMLNKLGPILDVSDKHINARIKIARNDIKGATELLTQAAAQEDLLQYDEPPAWWLPARETLGALLVRDGRPAEAEQVFRADLARNARSGRSLFGLAEALKMQGKEYDAGWVRRQYLSAWRNADTELRLMEY